jgi:hypothetical protein
MFMRWMENFHVELEALKEQRSHVAEAKEMLVTSSNARLWQMEWLSQNAQVESAGAFDSGKSLSFLPSIIPR